MELYKNLQTFATRPLNFVYFGGGTPSYLGSRQLQLLVERLQSFLDFLIPHYAAEGKTYLTVALGCTGGKHRSVALADRLNRYLLEKDLPATVAHRDLGKE